MVYSLTRSSHPHSPKTSSSGSFQSIPAKTSCNIRQSLSSRICYQGGQEIMPGKYPENNAALLHFDSLPCPLRTTSRSHTYSTSDQPPFTLVAFILSEVQIHSEYRRHLQPKIADAECYDFRLVLPPSFKTSTEPNCECRGRNPHEPKNYTIYASIPN